MKTGAEQLDVTSEELVALLEGARAFLGETGYQKLHAAIRTLGYVTGLPASAALRCISPAANTPGRTWPRC